LQQTTTISLVCVGGLYILTVFCCCWFSSRKLMGLLNGED
jgi:hypothetical protein